MKENFDYDEFEKRIKQESDRKIFEKVFDAQTLKTLNILATKNLFETLEHIISTGKEAHVFIAKDASGNSRAVKIFKKETTDFKRMHEYIVDDIRFKRIKKDRRNLVYAWAQKEYKNLILTNKAKLPVPMVLGFKENVIVMEFIGENEEASKRLKETTPTKKQLKNYKEQMIEFIAKLYLAGLIHADLSEYNVLVKKDNLYIIDFGQSVLLNHPHAKDFFERDVRNMATYFSKQGLETNFEEFYLEIKNKKNSLSKKHS